MNKRWVQGLVLASLTMLTLSGCGQKPMTTHEGTHYQADANQSKSDPQVTPVPEKKTEPEASHLQSKIKVYFGNENGTKLMEKEVTISYNNEDGKYLAALEALKSSGGEKLVSLFTGVTFKSAALDKGDLRVDLIIGSDAQLGSAGEDLFLQALKKTGFQFPEVSSIYIVQNGKKVDSLMGHMDLPYPILRTKS